MARVQIACAIISCLVVDVVEAARLVTGVALWFEVECPPGWAEVTASHGRAVLSDPVGNELGKQVGTPLGLKEEPVCKVYCTLSIYNVKFLYELPK